MESFPKSIVSCFVSVLFVVLRCLKDMEEKLSYAFGGNVVMYKGRMNEKFFVDAMAIKFCFLKTFVFFQLP